MMRTRLVDRSSPRAVSASSSGPPRSLVRTTRARWVPVFVVGLSAVLGSLAWVSLAPIVSDSRDELFEIPKGTYARRSAGEKIDILPDVITLTLGINDVLLLRNLDDVPQLFGPALIMPGQSFRLPFETASSYNFSCTAHANGQMTVIVQPTPSPGWQALQWRIARLVKRWGSL